MKKPGTLEDLLKAAGIRLEDVSQVLKEALNLDGDIPSGIKPDVQPDVVVTIQDNNDPKPWEPKQMSGEVAIVLVHKGNGEVEAGILGAISSPMDFIVLNEALKEMQKKVLQNGLDYALNHIKGE